jgi:hypothetical protein
VVSLPHGYGHHREGVLLAHATHVPGPSVNDLTDPSVVDRASGNAVLNGVPVTVEPSRTSRDTVEPGGEVTGRR